MKPTGIRWPLLLLALALGIACAQPIKTTVEQVGGVAAVGQDFTLAVKIDEDTPIEQLYGACFDMIIDTTKMTAKTPLGSNISIAGSILPSPRYKTEAFRNGQTDDIVFCVSREGPITGIDGSGELARFNFHGVAAGTATINFSDNYLVLDDESQRAMDMESVDVVIAP